MCNIKFVHFIWLFMAWLFIFSCDTKTGQTKVPVFDGQRAYEYLEKQVSFGPRIPGSENAAKCREYFINFFDGLGIASDTMQFIHNSKVSGKPVMMINVIASIDPLDKSISKRYLLAAHYDSRPRAEYDADPEKRENPINGANDGASGVAVLMELANLFVSQNPGVGIDLLLLDGEDFGRPGDLDEYFLGAKDFIKRDIKGKYEFALVIDMIGDSDLKIYREEHSNKYSPEITDLVWNTAAKLGETVFVDSVKHAIYDDHLSFMIIKLQSAVIIDFDYKYWHTTLDNADKCSAASLESVGRVVAELMYGL